MTGQQGKREPEGLVTLSCWRHGSDLSWGEWVASVAFACQTPGHQIMRWFLEPLKIFYGACICPRSFYFCKAAVLRQCLLPWEGVPPQAMWDWAAAQRHLRWRGGWCLTDSPISLGSQGILTDPPAVPAELRAENGRRSPAPLPTFGFILRNADFKIHKVSAFHQPCKTKDKC